MSMRRASLANVFKNCRKLPYNDLLMDTARLQAYVLEGGLASHALPVEQEISFPNLPAQLAMYGEREREFH